MDFEPWMLGAIDEAGYNGIRDEHIDKVVDAILEAGVSDVDYETFARCCRKCGIDPKNFKQADLDELQKRLTQ